MAGDVKIIYEAVTASAVANVEKLNKSLVTTGTSATTAAASLSKVNTSLTPVAGGLNNAAKASSSLGSTLSNLSPVAISAQSAILIVGAALITVISKMFEASAAAKALEVSFESGFKAFAQASADVAELTNQIDLAKNGFASKSAVLKEYNNTIGKTLGLANDINEAEAILVKNGEKYIQIQALKAIANTAFQKSAEASVAALRVMAESDKVSSGIVKNALKDINKEAQKEADIFKNIAANAQNLIKAINIGLGDRRTEKEVKLKIAKPKKAEIEREIKSFKNDVEEALGGGLDVLVNPRFDFGSQQSQGTQIGQQIGESMAAGISDGLSSGAKDIGEAIDPVLAALANTLTDVLESTIEASLINVGNIIGDTVGKALTGGAINVQDIFGSVFQIIGDGLKAFGKALIEYGIALKVIKIAIKNPVTAILAGIGLIAAGAILQSAVPKFATGTTNAPGGLTLVGERGPELIGLPRGSSVSSNGQTLAMANGGSNGGYIAELRVSGADFILMLKKANDRQSRNGGTTLF